MNKEPKSEKVRRQSCARQLRAHQRQQVKNLITFKLKRNQFFIGKRSTKLVAPLECYVYQTQLLLLLFIWLLSTCSSLHNPIQANQTADANAKITVALSSSKTKSVQGSSCFIKPMLNSSSISVDDNNKDQHHLISSIESSDVKLIRWTNSSIYDNLIQLSQNTVQVRNLETKSSSSSSSSNKQQDSHSARYQLVFESICGGWRNSIQTKGTSKPHAYWALDTSRGALVAKFIFYDSNEFVDVSSREARLISPIFKPIPAYHSMLDSHYYSSCKVTFRSYITIPAQLDLTLISFPKYAHSSAKSSNNLPNVKGHNIRQQQTTLNYVPFNNGIELWAVTVGKVSKNKQLAEKSGEPAAWNDHQKTLPYNLSSDSFYRLEFSAIPSSILSDSVRQNTYLNGVAIANFSLSPQCFGFEVDQKELTRIKSITGRDILADNDNDEDYYDNDGEVGHLKHHHSLYKFVQHLIETYKTSIFIAVIMILILVIFSTQYLLCAYHHSLNKKMETTTNNNTVNKMNLKKRPSFWARVCCCLANQRQRIYVTYNNEIDEKLKFDENMRNYLRPLQIVPENVELNENLSYLSNGTRITWTNQNTTNNQTIPLEPYHIDRKRLTLTKPLGKGAFGEVYQGYLVCHYMDNVSLDGPTNSNFNQFEVNAEELDQLESHSVKVAVKTLTDERMIEIDFIREAVNMSQVKHRNIVELIGVCFEEKPLYIVMELLQGGNLKNFLLKNRDKGYHYNTNSQTPIIQLSSLGQQHDSLWSFNGVQQHQQQQQGRVRLCMGDLLVFALDIARACDYLQKNQFIHRDLAARNCLLTATTKITSSSAATSPLLFSDQVSQTRNFVSSPPSAMDVNANHKVEIDKVYLNGYMNSSIVVKLADFGMTRDVYSHDYYRMGHKEMPVRWMPPECLDGVATTKSDVWSFGVFLWELFSMGQMPYQNLLDNHQVVEFIKSRRYAKPKIIRQNSSSNNGAADVPSRQNDFIDEPLLTISDEENMATGTEAACQSHHRQQVSDTIELLEADENEAADLPPLPLPHDNTPHPIYSIMCSCWATNPEDRPQFEEIANRLYWCLQMPELLSTSLPCFYEQYTPSGAHASRCESRHSGATQTAQPNWWCH